MVPEANTTNQVTAVARHSKGSYLPTAMARSYTHQSARILQLPGEIRNRIYGLVFSGESGWRDPQDGTAWFYERLQVLATCRQIYLEATPRFYRQIDASLELRSLRFRSRCFSDLLKKAGSFAMAVDLHTQGRCTEVKFEFSDYDREFLWPKMLDILVTQLSSQAQCSKESDVPDEFDEHLTSLRESCAGRGRSTRKDADPLSSALYQTPTFFEQGLSGARSLGKWEITYFDDWTLILVTISGLITEIDWNPIVEEVEDVEEDGSNDAVEKTLEHHRRELQFNGYVMWGLYGY